MWTYFKARISIQAKGYIFFLSATSKIELILVGEGRLHLLSRITLWKVRSFGNVSHALSWSILLRPACGPLQSLYPVALRGKEKKKKSSF